MNVHRWLTSTTPVENWLLVLFWTIIAFDIVEALLAGHYATLIIGAALAVVLTIVERHRSAA